MMRLSCIHELRDVRTDLLKLSDDINMAFYSGQTAIAWQRIASAGKIRRKINLFRLEHCLSSIWSNLIESMKRCRNKKESM